VGKSHSRPYVSNDNPYSEAHFKTMKYRPNYPDRFGSLADARAWAHTFFDWYNHHHRHTGLGLMTPTTVHYGLADDLRIKRQAVLAAAYAQHPERFVKGLPTPPKLPEAVWINPPQEKTEVP
jgi:putative transposase